MAIGFGLEILGILLHCHVEIKHINLAIDFYIYIALFFILVGLVELLLLFLYCSLLCSLLRFYFAAYLDLVGRSELSMTVPTGNCF